jgi:hypothetical protein
MARKTKDLAEAYPAACEAAKCKAVQPFVGALTRAVDAGAELTFVRLNGNSKELFNGRVDGKGAAAIASALTGTDTVEELDLSYNRIDDDGAEAIAQMLAKSPAMRRLDLRGNEIGPEGARRIADALASTGSSDDMPPPHPRRARWRACGWTATRSATTGSSRSRTPSARTSHYEN